MTETIRLLLVEDNENDAELLRLELERSGFDLESERVKSGNALRRELADRNWDIIISDFEMNGFDGLSALRIARELRPEVPFIFVSGGPNEERAAQLKREGALDYVLKTQLQRLPEVVRRARAALPRETQTSEPSRSTFAPTVDPIEQFVHDFNNHLAVIVSYSRFIQNAVEKDSTPYHDVRRVLAAAKDLESLTGQLRARSTGQRTR